MSPASQLFYNVEISEIVPYSKDVLNPVKVFFNFYKFQTVKQLNAQTIRNILQQS